MIMDLLMFFVELTLVGMAVVIVAAFMVFAMAVVIAAIELLPNRSDKDWRWDF